MKKLIYVMIFVTVLSMQAAAQRATTFTGTAVIYGSGFNTRTVTRPFTLIIEGRTSASDTTRYLGILDRGGQDNLLRALEGNDLGRFSLSGSVGVPLSAVVVDQDAGETRIRAVFRRWMGFGELRRGLRSTDYPFGYIELRVDPRTGNGDGTFIPAARIRFRDAKNGGLDTVEIEDFGTFPGRLMGVRMRGQALQ